MLLRSGFAGEIAMISDDMAPPYDRTLLTKDYLDGRFGDDHLPLSNRDLFSEDRVRLMLRTKIARIDPTARQVILDDGGVLSYSKLLLATGAAPKRPDFPGAELPHVKLLRSLEDCRDILAAAQAARHIAVVGGSFIGLEAAASLRDRGHKVSVVAPEKQPMARIFGSQLAELIAAAHRDHGVDWHVGRKVDQVTEGTVLLDDGTLLDADLVVVGIGVAPRIGLAQAAGIAIDDGVLVDEHLATSVPDIFAAGDIALWPDRYSGGRVRVEHWAVAERQGQIAALNMMGHRQSYVAVPFFWTKHFDLSIRYVGHAASWDAFEGRGRSYKSRRTCALYQRGTASGGRDRGARHGCARGGARLGNRRRSAQRFLIIALLVIWRPCIISLFDAELAGPMLSFIDQRGATELHCSHSVLRVGCSSTDLPRSCFGCLWRVLTDRDTDPHSND